MLREASVLAEVDLVAISHVLLADGNGDDYFDEILSWDWFHGIL